ncbi:MAG: anti sigma factor C-terminal domain-containing protein [Eubacteriales bacterium]|nr:anti sigma factor C-terminal domain-containing protein [Eubacteriales bacterium]
MDDKNMEQQINEIEDLLSLENDIENVDQKELTKSVKKRMSKHIYLRAFITVIVVVGIGIGLYFGSSKVVSLVCYDPTKEKELLEDYENDGSAYQDDFNALYTKYTGLIFPGKYVLPYSDNGEDTVRFSRGFGKYVYKYKISDCIEGIVLDGTYNSQHVITRNHKSKEESYGPQAVELNTFYNANLKDDPDWDLYYRGGSFSEIAEDNDLIQEIEQLPDSVILLVNASYKTVKTADEAVAFMGKHPEAEVTWVAVDDPYFFTHQATTGITLQSAVGYFYNKETLEKYPNIDDSRWNYDGTEGFEQHGGKELEQLYLSTLKVLIDHEKFVDAMCYGNKGMYADYYGVENMKKQYENVSQNGIDVIGMQMMIQKQDLLNLIEEDEFQYLDVRRIRLSGFRD